MVDSSALAPLPERQISDDQIQGYRDFYTEHLGCARPRLQARTDPELLATREQVRRLQKY